MLHPSFLVSYHLGLLSTSILLGGSNKSSDVSFIFFLLLLLQFYQGEQSFMFLPCMWSLLNHCLHLLFSLYLPCGSPSSFSHPCSTQNQMGTKLMVYFGMILVNPKGLGDSLMSSSLVGNLKRKFCKMVVRNRKSSILARLSPKQYRFPEEERGKEHRRGGSSCCCLASVPSAQCVVLGRRGFYTGV